MAQKKRKPFKELDVAWVLGTGRTGTSLLYHILYRLSPELVCFQEPPPGPILNFYSKIRAEGLSNPRLDRFILNHLRRSREKLFRKKPAGKYIEINPFLFGLTDLLQELFGKLRVVHMTRHPLTFISSAMNFTPPHAGGPFIHTPLWKLNAARALGFPQTEWQKLSEAEKWAWRWFFMNQKIISLREAGGSDYFLLKYEDLTSENEDRRRQPLKSLFHFLNLNWNGTLDAGVFQKKINASRNQNAELPDPSLRNRILKICQPLMAAFEYSDLPKPEYPQTFSALSKSQR